MREYAELSAEELESHQRLAMSAAAAALQKMPDLNSLDSAPAIYAALSAAFLAASRSERRSKAALNAEYAPKYCVLDFDVTHIVASALWQKIQDLDDGDVHPTSVASLPLLAFGRVCVLLALQEQYHAAINLFGDDSEEYLLTPSERSAVVIRDLRRIARKS